MQRIYLTLLSEPNKKNTKLIFSKDIVLERNDGLVRTSPIFGLDPEFDPISFKSGSLTLIYTLDAYNIINSIGPLSNWKTKIFLTHGIASIVLLNTPDSELDGEKLFQDIKDKSTNIIGFEHWSILDNEIVNHDIHLDKVHNTNPLNLDLTKVPIDDYFILEELITSYNYFSSFCQTYIPQYQDLANSLKLQIVDMYDQIRNLGGCPNTSLLLIRDEVLQTLATLKAVNVQAFNGVNVYNSNVSRSGRHSLFGIGMCYAGTYQLYRYCQKYFKKLIFRLEDFNNFISDGRSPVKEENFNLWQNKLSLEEDIYSIDKLYSRYSVDGDAVCHLIYFSHRYGYREAKKSISIAKQSVPLCIIPTWSLSTFFHEFLHSHVRILLTTTLEQNGNIAGLLEDVADGIKSINNHSTDSLKDFLQVGILDCIRASLCLENRKHEHQKGFTGDILKKGLRLQYDKINEIMVHTLDFHYFYDSDPDLYIKAIWMSWLMLPATKNRIPEYVMRTACAIGTNKDNLSLQDSFKWALDKIKTVLLEIKGYGLNINNQVDMTVSYIDKIYEEESDEEFEYIDVWGRIAFVTHKFLFSKRLCAEINYTSNAEVQNEEYTIPLNMGEFNSVVYENPVKIIQKNLYIFLSDVNFSKSASEIEGNSLYLYNLLSSTCFYGS